MGTSRETTFSSTSGGSFFSTSISRPSPTPRSTPAISSPTSWRYPTVRPSGQRAPSARCARSPRSTGHTFLTRGGRGSPQAMPPESSRWRADSSAGRNPAGARRSRSCCGRLGFREPGLSPAEPVRHLDQEDVLAIGFPDVAECVAQAERSPRNLLLPILLPDEEERRARPKFPPQDRIRSKRDDPKVGLREGEVGIAVPVHVHRGPLIAARSYETVRA